MILFAGTQPQLPEVGTYLPAAGIDDFVLFVPDAKKTPAIRAGTVNPNAPYKFALPPNFREGKVANIQSGNYCQVCMSARFLYYVADMPAAAPWQLCMHIAFTSTACMVQHA